MFILSFLLFVAPCDDIPLLGHDDFAVREAAQWRLAAELPHSFTLRDILSREVWHSSDPEIRWRCWSILLTYEKGVANQIRVALQAQADADEKEIVDRWVKQRNSPSPLNTPTHLPTPQELMKK